MSRGTIKWAGVIIAALVATLAAAATAHAAPGVAVLVEGREAARVRAAVMAALPAGTTPVAGKAVAQAAKMVRAKKMSARLAAIAERLKVATVVYAQEQGRGKVLVVVMHAGQASERRVARGAIGGAVAELMPAATPPPSAPVAPTPAPAVAPTPTAAPSPSPTPSPSPRASRSTPMISSPPPASAPADEIVESVAAPGGALVEVALDGGIGARRLQYTQALTGNLPSYSVAAVPWLGFRAALFPFARTRVAVLRDLGAYGDFGHSLYQQSVVAGSTTRLDATWSSFDAGLRQRIRFRARFSPAVGIALAYGRAAFTFDNHGQLVGDTPSVDYRYVRPALDGRVTFGPLTLFVDLGYRGVLSAGYVGSHFPHASIGGLDLGVGAAVALPRHLQLSLLGQYQRYFYDLRPQPGDPYVAGGALDEFAVGELALAYVY